jgi:D-threo-aldose 1-dehydrogenase
MMFTADQYRMFGGTGLRVPPIVFGSSALGNVRRVIPDQTRQALCTAWLRAVEPPVFVETSIHYGSGLALEAISRMLRRLSIRPTDLILSLQLGWRRVLAGGASIQNAVVRQVSYEGILECWEENCRILGGKFMPQLVSVQAPDEYLAAADSPTERDRRFQDICCAYRALGELKDSGYVRGVGLSARDWKLIQEIGARIDLDWVTLSGACTVLHHPPDVLELIASLEHRGIAIINAGVLHGGFLVGGPRFECREVNPESPADRSLMGWRKSFVALCEGHGVAPAHAAIQFGLSVPGVTAVLLSTSHPDRVFDHVKMVACRVPDALWASLKEERLVDKDFPYLG